MNDPDIRMRPRSVTGQSPGRGTAGPPSRAKGIQIEAQRFLRCTDTVSNAAERESVKGQWYSHGHG